jgi:hypothetical protein
LDGSYSVPARDRIEEMKGSAKSSWEQSRRARLQLNFTSRQLLLATRDWRIWLHIFDNMIRLERSPLKALRRTLLFVSGYPRKR